MGSWTATTTVKWGEVPIYAPLTVSCAEHRRSEVNVGGNWTNWKVYLTNTSTGCLNGVRRKDSRQTCTMFIWSTFPGRWMSRMHWLCRRDRLVIRFWALYGVGLLLFFVAWTVSYYVLPEGVLRGRTVAAVLAGQDAADTFFLEFVRIAGLNLLIATVCVLVPNRLVSVGRLPLGYLPPLLWAVMYGVVIGTNSFTISGLERLAPSLAVFGRSGLYEIAAYCLLAASTHDIALSRSPHVFSMRSEPIVPRPSLRDGVHLPGVITALLLLLAACAWEAYRIVVGA